MPRLGLLTQSHRAPAGAEKVPPATSSDAKAANAPPRFTYLPVSLPAARAKGAGRAATGSEGGGLVARGFDRFGEPDETRGAGDEGGLLGKIGRRDSAGGSGASFECKILARKPSRTPAGRVDYP